MDDLTKKEEYDLQKGQKIQGVSSARSQKTLKRVFVWLFAAVVLGVSLLGLINLTGKSSSPAGGEDKKASLAVINEISPDDWVKGNKDSKTLLVEYSDFQCPACGAYYPVVKKLVAEHGSEFQLAYRHFPLPQHGNAKNAAYAAEAAGSQGKFWEMHDMIFEHKNEWSEKSNAEDIFLQYASSLGLDLEKFNRDRDAETTKDKVQKSYDSAVANFINATPTFFLNGERIQPRSYEEFVGLIAKFNK